VANPRGDRETIPVAGSRAAITRADVKCRIRSRTTVELVVFGTFGLAGLGNCRAGAFGVNGGPGADIGGASLTLGFGGGGDSSHFRRAFLEGRSEDEARKNGEGEKDGRETHGVVGRSEGGVLKCRSTRV